MTAITPGLVTTVIPVRNRPRLVAEAVNSVLAQTYRAVEIIIIDSSTDETIQVCEALALRHPDTIVHVQQPAAGIPAARNAGITRARGAYIQFLDSDDLIAPEKFERQVAALENHPACGISYCRTREYRVGGTWHGGPARRTGERMATLFPHILRGRVWPTPSPLYRRAVVDANGPVRPLAIYEDWEYEARAAARHVKLHYCDEFLADKRDVHELEGLRKGAIYPHQWRDYAAVHHHVFEHAVRAGAGHDALDRFAWRVMHAARRCASEGYHAEAASLIALARAAASGAGRRLGITALELSMRHAGWQPVARSIDWFDRAAPLNAARRVRAVGGFAARWRHRAQQARLAISGQRLSAWPDLLASRWAARQSRPRIP